jgi:hypothetical protein
MQPLATVEVRGQSVFVRQFAVEVVDGPDRGKRGRDRSETLARFPGPVRARQRAGLR